MKLVFTVVLLAIFIFPTLAFAQFGPLVPQCTTINPMSQKAECSACDLVALAQNIINWFIYAAGVAAVLMFAYAGIIYATSATNPEQITKAHKIFWNVLLGMVFVLAAWLIVDTIMKALYQTESKFGPWNGILCARTGARVDPLDDTSVVGAGVQTAGSGAGSYTIPPGSLPKSAIDQGIAKTSAYDAAITAAAQKYGVSETEIRAIIIAESGGNAQSLNGSSVGLMQLNIDTARGLNPDLKNLSNTELTKWLQNPANNIDLGANYYSQQKTTFQDPNLATAAFNGGPGANLPSRDCDGLLRWQCPYDSRLSDGSSCYNTGLTGCTLNTGYVETRNYVTNVKQVREYLGS